MHDWAAVNGWSRLEMKTAPMSLTGLSRPTTKMSQGYGRYSVNIPVITPLPRSGLRRCHTTMLGQAANMQKQQVFKPHKHFVDSSTSHYIRYLKCSNQKSPMVHNQFSNLNEVGQRDSGTFGGKQEMKDAKSVHRPSPELDIAPSDLAKKKPTISKQEKITLPAIKNINPFTMKT
ncbi:hypothetical protein MAR_014368 [Mya arenaria]|uniref:Uncharacterized protein n=1 Tax=Mya arenaria TaxID=6604 RepID=A0ABY7G585_MYAAR|nr:hypothetical protein MAR_014368 [Mya arenaria]